MPLLVAQLIFLFMLACMICSSYGTSKASCILQERQALLNFKGGLEDWDNLISWNSDKEQNCCRWRGVGCDTQTGHVIKLDLRPTAIYYNTGDGYSPMSGEIGSSLLELRYLNYLDLSDNAFTKIPGFIGSVTELRFLSFSRNYISGPFPYQLGNLSKLQSLDISSMDGSFRRTTYNYPMITDNLEWLSHLLSLTYFKTSHTNFSNAAHWLRLIKQHPSLSELLIFDSQFPEIDPFLDSHISPSNSLKVVNLGFNTFHPSAFPLLFNISNKLVDFALRENSFKGHQLPNSFANMNSLEYIDISFSELQGGIPKAWGTLCNVKMLWLSSNNLSGQISSLFWNLTGCIKNSLEMLFLDRNQLSGSLPDISMFSSMNRLNLDDNKLSGNFPDFSNMSQLLELRIAKNNINGALSESIGKLTNLSVFDVSYNLMSGVVSESHFLEHAYLRDLDLSGNSLVLNFSASWIPPFQLNTIKLRSCILGPSFPNWIQTQHIYSNLDISNASIFYVIPNWFWNLPSGLESLNLSHNHIRGMVPHLPLKLNSFPAIDLSSNQFYGPIPLWLFRSAVMNLSKNMFSGSISSICDIVDRAFGYLDLSDNLLSSELPDCWMDWNSLVIINLGYNHFSGRIPSSIGFLSQIQSLHLRNNSLSGGIPLSLKTCNSLRLVDLGENKLSGDISSLIGDSLTSLMVLRLRSNEFYGHIPLHLCHMSALQVLDLSFNNISGGIPSCIFNLTAMSQQGNFNVISYDYFSTYSYWSVHEQGGLMDSYVDNAWIVWKGIEYEYGKTLGLLKIINLSNNKLTGEISREVTRLLDLRILNLSQNHLTGVIPQEIGKLKILEVLDLSNNSISGEIPQSMADIHSLNYLDLSNNKLSGVIPTGTQMQSFNASRYKGNSKLCGPPLSTKCKDNETTKDPKVIKNNDEQDGEWFDMTWFYIGIGSGFVSGFYGFCGVIILKKSLRFALFKLLDDMGEYICLTIILTVARLKTKLRN